MSNVTSGRRLFQADIVNFKTEESVKKGYVFG